MRFIKSAFDGILPKLWEASGQGKGLFGRATGVEPTGMNDQNEEEMDRYVRPSLPPSSCHADVCCRSTSRHAPT